MIDAAKYADLVLLLVDGAFGFEMETFEFLNILQVCIPTSDILPLTEYLASKEASVLAQQLSFLRLSLPLPLSHAVHIMSLKGMNRMDWYMTRGTIFNCWTASRCMASQR